ncbi:hypothetical protein EK0264_12530 [Epidermidibacterium keratini]|uniref:SGNH hydrolase-type esterase domain-containing protein n=1 Tax=Epidermidibacterium keratini TaxID=1891644 RepID=A0A7L4YQ43_9ACTN|nr:GDSL-type esterase/lipase family protein [Epidermidibacterium keratini]QHC01033.1 hypothetical protein EK0264_12530 [Epidermidibacterium keratini]
MSTQVITKQLRIHVVGDSLNAGIADVATNRKLRAWPAQLAAQLSQGAQQARVVADYAVSGAPSPEVLALQFGRLELMPGDLVCLWAGANDVLRPGCTFAQTVDAMQTMFGAIEQAGSTPLTMQLPRISTMLPGPARLMRRWDDYGFAVNDLVARLSARCGGVHLPWSPLPGLSGPDGTHLSAYGHDVYAARYAAALAPRLGTIAPPLPPAPQIVTTAAQRRWWYARHGIAWVVRRQFDPPRPIPARPAVEPVTLSAK